MVFDGPISFQTSMIHVDRCPKAAVTQAASKLRIAPFMYPAVYSKDGDTSWKLSTEDLDRLGRFQTKTILSFGTTRSANPWQHIIVEMACSVSTLTSQYLMRPCLPGTEPLLDARHPNTHRYTRSIHIINPIITKFSSHIKGTSPPFQRCFSLPREAVQANSTTRSRWNLGRSSHAWLHLLCVN